ncbi:MAG: hypothetical protein ACFB0C_19440 [Leptolyngbyaceae cyanobacterium]
MEEWGKTNASALPVSTIGRWATVLWVTLRRATGFWTTPDPSDQVGKGRAGSGKGTCAVVWEVNVGAGGGVRVRVGPGGKGATVVGIAAATG